jgi:uncharacterized protein (UPF0332 family)
LDKKTKLLVGAYVQKAERKLSVSRKLLESDDYDDAVSRAYYAVFHMAQALLLTEGEKAETHKGVVTLFGLLFVKTNRFDKRFGKYLTNLKDDRESGDYEVFSYLDKETAEGALREAGDFLEAGNLYLNGIGAL